MKLKTLLISSVFACAPTFCFAQDGNPFAMGNSLGQLNTSVINLGKYLGNWNLSSAPSESGEQNNALSRDFWPTLIKVLVPIPQSAVAQLPLTKAAKTSMELFGGLASSTFYDYEAADMSQLTPDKWRSNKDEVLKVIPFLDQQAYQAFPTLQAIQNVLSTPAQLYDSDSSGPSNYSDLSSTLSSDQAKSQCADNTTLCLYNLNRLESAGGIPYEKLDDLKEAKFNEVFGSDINSLVAPSLNFDSLIGPLRYQTEPDKNSNQAPDSDFYTGGFYGNSQLRQADAFIRYASGLLIPIQKSKSLADAIGNLANDDYSKRFKNAQAVNAYIVKLRTFAAQASVGMSNLYALLAKRNVVTAANGSTINMTGVDGKTQPLTQAKQEFKMAIRRFVPAQQGSGQSATKLSWVNMIQHASPAQVQRETALLLAEINYQMYLNRQLQERMLATMSAMQLQVLSTARDAVKFTPPQ